MSDLMHVVSVFDKLCSALTPNQESGTSNSAPLTPTLSPVRKAELRSTYIKQLSELKQLHESGVLTDNEFEEQRLDLVQLLRGLKQ